MPNKNGRVDTFAPEITGQFDPNAPGRRVLEGQAVNFGTQFLQGLQPGGASSPKAGGVPAGGQPGPGQFSGPTSGAGGIDNTTNPFLQNVVGQDSGQLNFGPGQAPGNPNFQSPLINSANPFSGFANGGFSGSLLPGFSIQGGANARAGNVTSLLDPITQRVEQANRPIFERNLQFGTGNLLNAAPGARSSAFQTQGIDLARQSSQDFASLVEAAGREASLQQAGLNTQASITNAQLANQRNIAQAGLQAQLASQADNAFLQQFINPSSQALQAILQGGFGAQPNIPIATSPVALQPSNK